MNMTPKAPAPSAHALAQHAQSRIRRARPKLNRQDQPRQPCHSRHSARATKGYGRRAACERINYCAALIENPTVCRHIVTASPRRAANQSRANVRFRYGLCVLDMLAWLGSSLRSPPPRITIRLHRSCQSTLKSPAVAKYSTANHGQRQPSIG